MKSDCRPRMNVCQATASRRRASPGDITKQGPELLNDVIGWKDRLDILVNNVGNRDRRPTLEMSRKRFRDLVDVNLVAAFDLSREAIPALTRSGNGRLIFVTSIAGPIARAGDPAYTAAKRRAWRR